MRCGGRHKAGKGMSLLADHAIAPVRSRAGRARMLIEPCFQLRTVLEAPGLLQGYQADNDDKHCDSCGEQWRIHSLPPFGSRQPEAGAVRFQYIGSAIWLAGLAALRGAIQAAAWVHSAYGVTAPRPGSGLVHDRGAGTGRPAPDLGRVWIERPHGSAGCGGRPRRQHLGELLFEFSFWSAIYLPPFQQHRPLAYGCHRPPWAPSAMSLQ